MIEIRKKVAEPHAVRSLESAVEQRLRYRESNEVVIRLACVISPRHLQDIEAELGLQMSRRVLLIRHYRPEFSS